MTNKIEVNSATQSLFESLLIMAAVVEARDAYTGGHLWRVSQFSRILALELGLSLQDSLEISLGGFLHDLGKIGIPDAILNKKEALTDYEYEVIKTHPDIGAKLIELHPLSHFALEAIRYHHERPDGKGYPDGLKKEEIPLVAKIVGVCDAFDAMTSSRPYREGMSIEKALAILKENRGSQFCQASIDAFISLANRNAIQHIVGHSEPGMPLQNCPVCGPTMVIPHNAKSGDHIACPACTGLAELTQHQGGLIAKAFGYAASPALTAPKADEGFITSWVANMLAEWQAELT
jgi:HD-GYP domain-containing protein (c-di-GMP phosphodiesterase class II)